MAVTKLVKFGHRFHEIPDYTLQQVVLLLEGIEKEEAATRAANLTDLGAAIGSVLGGAKQFSKHLNDLNDRMSEDG